jgi:hypothetical protein
MGVLGPLVLQAGLQNYLVVRKNQDARPFSTPNYLTLDGQQHSDGDGDNNRTRMRQPVGWDEESLPREQDTLIGRESGWAQFDDCRSKPLRWRSNN